MLRALAFALAALLLAPAAPAVASGCFPVAGLAPKLLPAAWRTAALPAGATVRLTFLGHASFLLETAGGATAITDFNAYVGAPVVPDIVTMNNAHDTHYTSFVPPGIDHVLRGWNTEGGEARHDVTHLDLRVRNVPTSVHGRSGAQGNSNSMFVFEVEDLCIVHVGHLHQVLTDQQLAELGVIDVALVPVDGTWTMSHEEMVEVILQIRPNVVVPMHYFGSSVLGRFLAEIEDEYAVELRETPELVLSRTTLPQRTVVVLPGS
jgi:L-ascorbate metabolism protein UlaG (beta-lactamase superfamily)